MTISHLATPILLTCAILLGSISGWIPGPAQAQVCAPAQECGDVNADDVVSVGDALTVLRRSLGLPAETFCSCTGGEECPAGGTLHTQQTMCWDPLDVINPIDPVDCPGTGQDGEHLRGLPLEFRDNGDGTISDLRTTLMWEKLSNDNGIHDYDNFSYLWEGAFQKILDLNEQAYAGYTDWRVPNIRELATLVDFSAYSPAVHSVFHNNCTPGCTIAECSCTNANDYWSSTTYQQTPSNAWNVDFRTGQVDPTGGKTTYKYLRAVRGGY